MSDTLFYFKPRILDSVDFDAYPGLRTLQAYTKLYSAGAVPVDRTGSLALPIRTTTEFPIPAFRPLNKTFGQICDERARELLDRAEKLDANIYTQWSGGIDSTLALASLLKNASPDEKKRITVLMSRDSIDEYPLFYEQYIRAKLKTETPRSLPRIVGTKNILVNGEHNDQLMGSDAIAKLIIKYGNEVINRKVNPSEIIDMYADSLDGDAVTARFYFELFDSLVAQSPVPIVSTFDFLWWINFNVKWATVFYRTLTYADPRNASGVNSEYVRTYYSPFYNTEDFQLWSLNNLDKRIKDRWVTYKWVCKELIYDFTKDAHYRDTKRKEGSLSRFIESGTIFKAIDSNHALQREFDFGRYYVADNQLARFEREHPRELQPLAPSLPA